LGFPASRAGAVMAWSVTAGLIPTHGASVMLFYRGAASWLPKDSAQFPAVAGPWLE